MHSSDSSDSDDLEQLRSAIDTGLLKESFYNEEIKPKISEISKKSERYIEDDIKSENSVFVSKCMQDHIWSKLSQLINNQIEFVDVPCHKSKRKKTKGGVKLLSHEDEYLSHIEILENPIYPTKIIAEQTKEDLDRVHQCAVTYEWVMSGDNEIKSENIKKPKIEYYKSKKFILHLIEPVNEFTEMRRKNNWSESKISRKYKAKAKKITPITENK